MLTTRTNKVRLGLLAVTAGFAAVFAGSAFTALSTAHAAKDEGKNMLLVHNVYFALKESNEANQRKLIEACDKYLSDHPGTVFYAAGTVSELDRPVNDRDWDVGLHVIFKDAASHDAYQVAPKHLKFIEENKDGWAKVRVFDTDAKNLKK